MSAADLVLPPPSEGSEQVAARVLAARQVQTVRLSGKAKRTNAELDGELLEAHATPDEHGQRQQASQLGCAAGAAIHGYCGCGRLPIWLM